MAEIRMTWKVRAALKLYDSFTGRPAALTTVQAVLGPGLAVIRKSEGLLVLVETRDYKEKEQERILLRSPIFLEKEVVLPMTGTPGVTVVYLEPGERYPAPARSVKLYGAALPGADLFFVFTEGTDAMKLLGDHREADGTLEIYHPGVRSLEGCTLELESGGARRRFHVCGEREAFRQETGRCMVEALPAPGEADGNGKPDRLGRAEKAPEAFLDRFPKLETSVRAVYHSRAGQNGSYIFFLPAVPDGGAPGRIEMETEHIHKEAKVRVPGSGSVRLDFTEEKEG